MRLKITFDRISFIALTAIVFGGVLFSGGQARAATVIISSNVAASTTWTGSYQLASFVADGKHMPVPQEIASSTIPTAAAVVYHQDYSPTDLTASTVHL